MGLSCTNFPDLALLDRVATEPGIHAGPITISPGGNWYVFHSGRFDPGCAGSTCLTIAPADWDRDRHPE